MALYKFVYCYDYIINVFYLGHRKNLCLLTYFTYLLIEKDETPQLYLDNATIFCLPTVHLVIIVN